MSLPPSYPDPSEIMAAITIQDDPAERAKEGMKRIGECIVVMESEFRTIQDFVQWLDGQRVVRDVYGDVKLYASEWSGIHEAYTDLIQESQVTAHNLARELGYLVDVLLPISHNVNFQDALKEKAVDHYIKDLENFTEDAEKSRTRFLRIEKNVQNFQEKLTTALYASAGAPGNEGFANLEAVWREMENSNVRRVFYELEDRLSVVGRVWPILTADSEMLQRHLKDLRFAAGVLIFEKRVNSAKDIYDTFMASLDVYVSAVVAVKK
ncbi:hypothetical protein CPB84DRAFT_1852249 [Gymnopilus junonius]|uniref:Uncharacterized protein n=1 Tax=Gymnopilus junonius TaxID=109634 RepID=A0A9P5NAR1_GYMJU|nr:hypothetical protein CPB84DRAFT_1852249 [Gymnopilus junonius]